jgi:hypothetical protein
MIMGTAVVLMVLVSCFVLQPRRERQSAKFRYRVAATVFWANIGIQTFGALRSRTALDVFLHLLTIVAISGSCLITMRDLRRKFSGT